jgi:hypothetical protein
MREVLILPEDVRPSQGPGGSFPAGQDSAQPPYRVPVWCGTLAIGAGSVVDGQRTVRRVSTHC